MSLAIFDCRIQPLNRSAHSMNHPELIPPVPSDSTASVRRSTVRHQNIVVECRLGPVTNPPLGLLTSHDQQQRLYSFSHPCHLPFCLLLKPIREYSRLLTSSSHWYLSSVILTVRSAIRKYASNVLSFHQPGPPSSDVLQALHSIAKPLLRLKRKH